MGKWSELRKQARFNVAEKKIKRLLSRQFECPICGRKGNMIALWGHSISKDQECEFYELQDPVSRLKTLVMMISFGIPVPDKIRSDITNDLLEEMDLMEILAQPELAALVVLSGLGMDPECDVHKNAQEPSGSDDELPQEGSWNDWDKGAANDRDQTR